MITFLQGTIVEKQPMRVVLDVNGVGYEMFIPLSSYDQLPPKNESCRLLTYDHVREDLHALYGFRTEPERRMFTMLMTVSGIGPKLALSTLSGLSMKELHAAIVSGDVKRLSSTPGIGKKTAERIVVELRDKISTDETIEAIAGAGVVSEADATVRDAILALISLGYKQAEARKMIGKVVDSGKSPANVEDIIREALAK